jgi:NhaA family Na+:H+ antiporter
LLYAVVAWGDASALRGWAIPAATDIAFALGALSLAGTRAPLALKVFLLTLATIDDLAAIIIIAIFYSGDLSAFALTGAAACLAVLVAMNKLGVVRSGTYLLVGIVLWSFVLKSGVHATLAGVALGILIPVRRPDSSSPVHELEEAIHPYVKFLILPLFAFANAGLPLNGFSMDGLTQSVTLGVILGLVLGKPVGILLASALVLAFGLARLPNGVSWKQLAGVACLAGIGFTMSLFIGSLAFSGEEFATQVRVGVIVASIIATGLGLAILFAAPANAQDDAASRH